MASTYLSESLDHASFDSGDNSPPKAVTMEGQRLPHLNVRVGGGLHVSLATLGTPTPPCTTDGLRSRSAKLLFERERPLGGHTSPARRRHCSAQQTKSTSHLLSEAYLHMHPCNGVLNYLQSPTYLGTYAEKRTSKVISNVMWSPDVTVRKESKLNSQDGQCGHANRGSRRHLLTKRGRHQRSYSFNCGRGETLLSREQAPPTCRRRVLTDYEKNLTFRPKLNSHSLRIASKHSHNSLPLLSRLSKNRKNPLPHYDREHLTFAPKLNPLSLKLAHERASKMSEIQARQAQQTAARIAEATSNFTFKPHVSEKSQRIAQGLGMDFLTRQQRHLAKKEKSLEIKSPPRPAPRVSPFKRAVRLKSRALPLALSQSYPQEADSAKAASCTTSPPRASLSDTSKANFGEEDVGRNEATPTTPPTRAQKMGEEETSSNPKGPSRVSRGVRNKAVHKRTNSAGGEKEVSVSPSKKMTGASEEGPSKKTDRLLTAKFESLSETDRVKRVKMNSEKIMKSKKVFLLRGGYRRIRKSLRKRGWVEQNYYKNSFKSTNDGGTLGLKKGVETSHLNGCGIGGDSDGDSDADVNDGGDVSEEEHSDEEEYCMLSRAVRNCVPNFVWTIKRDDALFRSLAKDSMVNHFVKASSFTTKVGLCTNLRNLLWFGDTDPDTFFPRCYLLSSDEEKATFIEDYRFTAALCILKALSQRSSYPHPSALNSLPTEQHTVITSEPLRGDPQKAKPVTRPSPTAKVPEEAAQLAVKAVEAFLGSLDHNDIEGSQYQLCPKLSESEWEKLIQHFYSVAFENGQLGNSAYMCSKAGDLLEEVAQHYPQLLMDGVRNVWIIKPGASSRGRGITCMDRLEPILDLVSSTVVKKEGKWVIQKYIERPLLLFDTKFDIRQWFLVTDWNPLTMWMYKECYLRFSTQKYTLENLDQSIHLCNNSIQKHYTNNELRADALPRDNMWDSDTFREHLSAIGRPKVWESTIYPGMKQALINVMQVAQDEIEQRKNSFELYGADFMLSSDYRPWLIEINCSPSMESSTSVTERLCQQVLEDTLKVVLDRREVKDCDVGGFELAYRQPRLEVPNYVGIQLCVQGHAVTKPRSYANSYVRKTLSMANTSDQETAAEIHASQTSPMQQASSDGNVKECTVSDQQQNGTTCRQNLEQELIDSKEPSGSSKTSNSSNSAPAVQPPVISSISPLRTHQTCLSSCRTPEIDLSRPGVHVSIVEINYNKLPNTNLRVS